MMYIYNVYDILYICVHMRFTSLDQRPNLRTSVIGTKIWIIGRYTQETRLWQCSHAASFQRQDCLYTIVSHVRQAFSQGFWFVYPNHTPILSLQNTYSCWFNLHVAWWHPYHMPIGPSPSISASDPDKTTLTLKSPS